MEIVLSPNVHAVTQALAQAGTTVARVDSFAFAAINTIIGHLAPDPDWLGPMRTQLTLLNGAGATWQQKKPTILAPILSQFNSHYSLFAGFAAVAEELGNDRAGWIDVLKALHDSLSLSANATRAAEQEFILQVNYLNNVQQVFEASLSKAWKALADEEEQMVALAEQITLLTDQVNALQEDLTSGMISSGKGYIQSSISITYSLVSSAGTSVPYLTIAGLLFTVGKQAYDLIVTHPKIEATLNKIVELRLSMSQAAQAAAMSKAIIQLIYNFDRSLLAVGRQLPALSQMWEAESEKVAQAIRALKAGAIPRQMMEIVAFPSALASWQTLSEFVTKLTAAPQAGKAVILRTTIPKKEE